MQPIADSGVMLVCITAEMPVAISASRPTLPSLAASASIVAPDALAAIKRAALDGENIFATLMEACKVCTLGQISAALYKVGGQYRRNM